MQKNTVYYITQDTLPVTHIFTLAKQSGLRTNEESYATASDMICIYVVNKELANKNLK